MDKKSVYVVAEMSDDTNLPVAAGSTNYYVCEQEVYADGDRGRIKILAFVGCQMGARSFAYELADRATLGKMTRKDVTKECFQYVAALHTENRKYKKPVDTHADIDIDSPVVRQQTKRVASNNAPKHDVTSDINQAIG